ncbi:hypothetical protein AGRA3207_005691 [Actinomadura graeca]|uniref:Lipoprotein n=1 Tax=Actinomadura graeca TaxID=2750812 RepID=A0ABX8R0I9_9ACTN|nr:SurA N-terminal domain-containing protein [Actinomadura graeca]QXJ24378.1 hypothetical protein AGRA3207_005691 [Actinomadura graeca]
MLGRSVKAAAAALVAAGALAGCSGGSPKAGTAAVVGDDRITVTALSQTVRDWREQFKDDPLANRMRAGSINPADGMGSESGESDLRDALTLLVNFRVAEKMARTQGVAVPEGQTDQAVDLLNEKGGAGSITLASGLPRDRTRELARFIATQRLVMQRLGADGNPQSLQTAAAGKRWNELFRSTADGMHIEVNPRYGTFDPVKGNVGPVLYRLSTPESGIGRT